MHEGNRKALHIVDRKATVMQRSAIEALVGGQHGGTAFGFLHGHASQARYRLGAAFDDDEYAEMDLPPLILSLTRDSPATR
jgi:hypothetical protein